jgi:hypothetical protein
MLYLDHLFLGLFGEGGDGGAGNASGDGAAAPTAQEQTGVSAPDAGVHQGRRSKAERLADVQAKLAREQAAAAQPQNGPEPEADFDELIKGKYKDAFGAKVSEIIRNRFPANQANEERLNKLSPMMEALASAHGIERDENGNLDEDAIIQAVLDDDNTFAEQAAERGMSVETYREFFRLQQEHDANERARARELEETQRQEAFQRLVQQAEAARQLYPGLDLKTELDNPAFVKLIGVGVDAKTAYEVCHKDEILRGGMQYALQVGAQKTANSVATNSRRPIENGMGSAATSIGNPVGPMSKEYREQIKRRAARGEKVVL